MGHADPQDPLTFAAVAVGLAVVDRNAILVPARRVASLDPWTALRRE